MSNNGGVNIPWGWIAGAFTAFTGTAAAVVQRLFNLLIRHYEESAKARDATHEKDLQACHAALDKIIASNDKTTASIVASLGSMEAAMRAVETSIKESLRKTREPKT